MAMIPTYERKVPLVVDKAPETKLAAYEESAAYTAGHALQGAGAAMTRFGYTVAELEDNIRRRTEQDENTKTAGGFDLMTRQYQADTIAAREKMAADGAGFQAERLKAFDTETNKFLATVPDRLKEQYKQAIAAQRVSFGSQAGQIEMGQAQNFTRSTINTLSQSAQTEISADPAATDPAIARMTKVINDSRLPALEKIERIAAIRQQLLAADAAKRLQNDPAGMSIAMGRGAARDPVAKDLPNVARALLNAIAGGESGGKYDIRYTPGGGATFDLSTGQHPRIREAGPEGPSDASGRYQFLSSTWDGPSTGGGAARASRAGRGGRHRREG